MPKIDTQTLLLIFVIVTGLAFLLQTIILFAIFLALKKTVTAVQQEVEDLRDAVLPVVDNTREFLSRFSEFYTRFSESYARIAPKVESVAADLAHMTASLRDQNSMVQTSVAEVVDRVHQQTARIDQMFTTVLDAVDRAGGFVADMVSRPIRQLQAMLASVKAVIETLGQPQEHPEPPKHEGQPAHAAPAWGPDPDDYL